MTYLQNIEAATVTGSQRLITAGASSTCKLKWKFSHYLNTFAIQSFNQNYGKKTYIVFTGGCLLWW